MKRSTVVVWFAVIIIVLLLCVLGRFLDRIRFFAS